MAWRNGGIEPRAVRNRSFAVETFLLPHSTAEPPFPRRLQFLSSEILVAASRSLGLYDHSRLASLTNRGEEVGHALVPFGHTSRNLSFGGNACLLLAEHHN